MASATRSVKADPDRRPGASARRGRSVAPPRFRRTIRPEITMMSFGLCARRDGTHTPKGGTPMRSEGRREGGEIDGRGDGDRPKRSERQRLASIANGSRSKGPRPENLEKVRLNGLKHGLRTEQVILPGEDPAEFEALRGALHDEWEPATLTRALLVERLAIAAWRLRRATRADIAYRRQTAEGTAVAFD